MKPVEIRCLIVFILSISSLPCFAGSGSEYGDKIKNTPEYEKITTPRNDDRDHDHHHHYPYHYHDPYYGPGYRSSSARYRSTGSGGVGLAGSAYFGVSVGKSEFDYDDIEDGDASIFRFGYRPENSRLGYELSFFSSGDSQVTSLTDIDIEVDTINLLLTVNSSTNNKSRLNFFGQGGIYFADTTLSGPFDSESENSNGLLLGLGIEIMLNQHFSLRAEAYNLFDVEDFVDDESISSLNLGGNFIF
jgi:opacity protein-like surface antigen